MKIDQIILEPFLFSSYIEINILQRVNEHAEAYVKGILSSSEPENLIEQISVNEIFTVHGISEEGEEKVVFKGLISKVLLFNEDDIRILEIWASSHTCLLDIKEKVKIFQDTNQKFSEIAKYIGKKQEARVIYTEGKVEQIEHLIVQYRETDWDFLKRVASMLHTVIVADSINGRISYCFGMPRLKQEELGDYTFKTKRNLKQYHYSQNNGRDDCKEKDTLTLEVETRDFLDLCTPVLINGVKYYVKSMDCKLKGHELINTYELVFANGMKTCERYNERISGASIEGIVNKVAKDQIQIRFPQDVDEPCIWFPYATAYSSPDGTGWYCMPEIGEQVRAYFPNLDERYAIAVNMVHLTSNLNESPDIKYIRSPYEKEIRFEPNALHITNNKGISVVLDDKKGITIKSSRDIFIESEGNVDVQSGKGIKIAGDNGVTIRQGDNKIEVRDGIKQTARTIEQR